MDRSLLEYNQFAKHPLEPIQLQCETSDIINILFKFVLCLSPLLGTLQYKHCRTNNSLISCALRIYMVYVIFGLLSITSFSHIIYFFWFLSDAFKFLHSIIGNSFTGTLKYRIGVAVFIIHGILECLSIFLACSVLYFPLKHLLIMFFVFHIISLKILLNYKFNQLCWFRKSSLKKHQ
ncbi:uncharacterized protein VICG_01038 [Vittaforma corneae ATCC 50505]|uniref:Uncharacterized protein n=1 Tax=Vittaforma corneae (strain ATCC 50505) TaxID=993615 RepID=L2GMI9_VITCO|nr:uncharacterized protein VICG_01038 [Vittaforma corneae ATCC 50505]ELA41854.1 hypothetical protein VICG_01038 [Vittaforma corneae ATCC 50505]